MFVTMNRNGGYNEKSKSIECGYGLCNPDLCKMFVCSGLASVARVKPGWKGQWIQLTQPMAE
jgi:hypothetical protein